MERVRWECARPGCNVVQWRVPSLARQNRYCSVRCGNLVTQRIRYAATPTSWEGRARRFRQENDVGTFCQICGLEEFSRRTHRHHLDHCHKTGKIRGLLCQGCNLHLGRWEQKSDLLLSYLSDCCATPMRYTHNQKGRRKERRDYRLSRLQVCDACGMPPKTKSLCVDHCHEQMVIRGLLCIPCNTTLGWYENNNESVDNYLAAVNEQPTG